jgi:hypothetical protein
MKNFMRTLAIATIASSTFAATAAHALSAWEFQQMKKDCIAEGGQIGRYPDGTYSCYTGAASPEGAITGVKPVVRNDAMMPGAKMKAGQGVGKAPMTKKMEN